MKRTPQGWPKGAEDWTLEQMVGFLMSEQEKPFQYGWDKFTRFVDDCATDRKFVEGAPELLKFLILVRDGMADGATEHWTVDDYMEWPISEQQRHNSSRKNADIKRRCQLSWVHRKEKDPRLKKINYARDFIHKNKDKYPKLPTARRIAENWLSPAELEKWNP